MVKRKKLIISLCILLLVTTASIIGIITYNKKRTFPIGDNTQVVYLGKKTTGSNFIFSDQRELTSYYYGTDMAPEELAEYFHAELERVASQPSLKLKDQTYSIELVFYEEENDSHKYPTDFARNTTKKYLFSTLSQNYEALKTAANR